MSMPPLTSATLEQNLGESESLKVTYTGVAEANFDWSGKTVVRIHRFYKEGGARYQVNACAHACVSFIC